MWDLMNLYLIAGIGVILTDSVTESFTLVNTIDMAHSWKFGYEQ